MAYFWPTKLPKFNSVQEIQRKKQPKNSTFVIWNKYRHKIRFLQTVLRSLNLSEKKTKFNWFIHKSHRHVILCFHPTFKRFTRTHINDMYLDFKQTEIIIEKQHFNERKRKKMRHTKFTLFTYTHYLISMIYALIFRSFTQILVQFQLAFAV